jgi:hypothetical protein
MILYPDSERDRDILSELGHKMLDLSNLGEVPPVRNVGHI